MENTERRLELTEDEAFALLGLAMTASVQMDSVSEKAVRKLAEYCKSHPSNHNPASDWELIGAG